MDRILGLMIQRYDELKDIDVFECAHVKFNNHNFLIGDEYWNR